MGEMVSAQATLLVRDLWMWCLNRNIRLSVQYLPGKENTIADEESRVMKDSSDGLLNRSVFRQIECHFPEMNVGLFASRLPFQLLIYFS